MRISGLASLVAAWFLLAAVAEAAPQAGVYKGVTGQGRTCGTSGKAPCRASATVTEDGSTTFQWRFHLRCSNGWEFARTVRSNAFATGSDEVSSDGEVAFKHIFEDGTARRAQVTSVVKGTFTETRFRGTLKVSLVYTDLRSQRRVTCRMPGKRPKRLVLNQS